MSSLVRRLTIRIMQKRGYVRTHYRLVKNKRGDLEQLHVRRGGVILDPENELIGYQWPRFISASEEAA